jgi:hypothetical protein
LPTSRPQGRTVAKVIAYLLAGVPAAIGVAFVARFAFITSDTAIDGAANGFLFGMIATGAFSGPACVIGWLQKAWPSRLHQKAGMMQRRTIWRT